MTVAAPARPPRIWPAAIAVLAALCILVALGAWQMQRLQWKNAIIAAIAHAEQAPAVPLPARPTRFEKVGVQGTWRPGAAALYGDEVHDTARGLTRGGHLLMVLDRAGAPPVVVDRGWVPQTRPHPVDAPAGPVNVSGFVLPPERPGALSAQDDPAHRLFYTRDPRAIGRALGVPDAAPFTLIALGHVPPGTYPVPAKHLPRPPDNHLQYALTWFGMAGLLVIYSVIWLRKARRA
ncbi:MAG TPA: SURF1 family protein [Acetobacteraceae bacterium]|nr:SURF1 family protein [Acetobacteraceae bacterium]